MTTPRQLAPTVGPVIKGNFITGEARRGMENLAIGRVYTNHWGKTEIDDYGWSPEADSDEEGVQFVFGKVNIGIINASGNVVDEFDSVSEATTIIQSNGE